MAVSCWPHVDLSVPKSSSISSHQHHCGRIFNFTMGHWLLKCRKFWLEIIESSLLMAFHIVHFINEFILFFRITFFHILNNIFSIIIKYYLKSSSNFTSVKWKMLNGSIFMLDFFHRPHISRTKWAVYIVHLQVPMEMNRLIKPHGKFDHVAPPTYFHGHWKAYDINYWNEID